MSGLLCGLPWASSCGETLVSLCRAEIDPRASASAALSSGRKGALGTYNQVRYATKDFGPIHIDTVCVCVGGLAIWWVPATESLSVFTLG